METHDGSCRLFASFSRSCLNSACTKTRADQQRGCQHAVVERPSRPGTIRLRRRPRGLLGRLGWGIEPQTEMLGMILLMLMTVAVVMTVLVVMMRMMTRMVMIMVVAVVVMIMVMTTVMMIILVMPSMVMLMH